ncbi:hypothetical protein BN946_scf184579.g16 [Trametes cinnabarina]|uniref:Uncharacterized protein n=1 Tax=Pycnoporus cinnabarinus TaxID=5643 RepID=A0A060S877_PYCCI|nr:hypothetical protein BN946_scf184579.g16 [Trametes cinnabarina]
MDSILNNIAAMRPAYLASSQHDYQSLPHADTLRPSPDSEATVKVRRGFLWTLAVLLVLYANIVFLIAAAWTAQDLLRDLAARLEATTATHTRALPRPDPLYGLMK